MKGERLSASGVIALALAGVTHAQILPNYQTRNDWYSDAQSQLAEKCEIVTAVALKMSFYLLATVWVCQRLPLVVFARDSWRAIPVRKVASRLNTFPILPW